MLGIWRYQIDQNTCKIWVRSGLLASCIYDHPQVYLHWSNHEDRLTRRTETTRTALSVSTMGHTGSWPVMLYVHVYMHAIKDRFKR